MRHALWILVSSIAVKVIRYIPPLLQKMYVALFNSRTFWPWDNIKVFYYQCNQSIIQCVPFPSTVAATNCSCFQLKFYWQLQESVENFLSNICIFRLPLINICALNDCSFTTMVTTLYIELVSFVYNLNLQSIQNILTNIILVKKQEEK